MPKKSNADLQTEILETDLETKRIALEQTREQNAAWKQRRDVSARTNANRQHQFKMDHASQRHAQEHICQHMAGGDADGNPLEGGGKFAFAIVSATLMPDGVTYFMQCPRCRMKLYGRNRPAAEEARMAALAREKGPESPEAQAYADHIWFKEVFKLWQKEGLGKKSLMRGPTFGFNRVEDGAPVIPDITGYASSGAGGR
jgi:hypothetical protein